MKVYSSVRSVVVDWLDSARFGYMQHYPQPSFDHLYRLESGYKILIMDLGDCVSISVVSSEWSLVKIILGKVVIDTFYNKISVLEFIILDLLKALEVKDIVR